MGKWTRRAFLSTGLLVGGGIAVGVALRPGNRRPGLAPLVTEGDETLVHTWVKLDANNQITAIVPHSEMGQGVGTALAQMLADELDADWDLVHFEEAPAVGEFANYPIVKGLLLGGASLPDALVPTVDGVLIRAAQALDVQITGGSMSIRSTGVYGMRVAGAAVREMLVTSAAEAWDVPVGEVVTRKSHLIHESSGRRAPYSAFAEAALQRPAPTSPQLKTQDQFKIMGRHVERQDIPSKVDGTAQFALDVSLPDMLYATVQRGPVFGSELEGFDDTQARQVAGVVDVLELPSTEADALVGSFKAGGSVAVVAEGFWAAKQGLEAMDITWKATPNDGVTTDSIFEQFDRDIQAGVERQADVAEGDVQGAMDNADQVIEADYRAPFLAHTCMEPLNATARVENGECEIWVGCQSPLGFRKAVADALGFSPERVTLHNCFMGGGFGRKSRADWAVQTALIAQKVGRPVKLIWTREEDVRQDFYRPAVLSRFRAALDANGNPTAWENTYVEKMEPIEAPVIPYAVGARDIGAVSSPTHVPYGAWRSVDHSSHGFFVESFIDELAIAAGQDPVSYRDSLLIDQPRLRAVLKRAKDESGWGSELGPARGRGVALQESFGSIVAHVVEVTVVDGKVRVDRVISVADPGLAVSPDGFVAQIESGIIYGLTAALHGEITIKEGRVEQGNFGDYKAVRMSAAPKIEVHVINSGHAIGGAGEPGTPGIAPALANAIFDATGKRLRDLPIEGQSLKA
ncbi:MAG: isoquinoline 1-oxidoreductase [Spirochaeta sp.]|nr:isoquinoline 1-oxidoreductase [Spirochaeta sp.]RPG07409.1 MAG: xanthine dehydrogenase family protein molybdopterin-binding subunit [Proteobacteria bacterium TMED72]